MYHPTVSAMPLQFGDLAHADNGTGVSLTDMSTLLATSKALGVFAVTMQQAQQVKSLNIEPPAPPKKPLSPYMTFSKEVRYTDIQVIYSVDIQIYIYNKWLNSHNWM